jgi:hypothetical protein
MTKVKTVEFWLFALPALAILAGWAGAFEQETLAKYYILSFLILWLILAVYWMFRELVRRFRS